MSVFMLGLSSPAGVTILFAAAPGGLHKAAPSFPRRVRILIPPLQQFVPDCQIHP